MILLSAPQATCPLCAPLAARALLRSSPDSVWPCDQHDPGEAWAAYCRLVEEVDRDRA